MASGPRPDVARAAPALSTGSYRLLYKWAWRRKCRAIADGAAARAAHASPLDRRMFGTIRASLGGRLRYVLVCDRDMDAEVPARLRSPRRPPRRPPRSARSAPAPLRPASAAPPLELGSISPASRAAQVRQFFEVAVSATVLPVFGFPEAGGLVAMQTPASRALADRVDGDDAGQGGGLTATVDSVGFPLPCNELKLARDLARPRPTSPDLARSRPASRRP